MATFEALHAGLGARFGEQDGVVVPRHYGDPAGEYAAARARAVVVDRADRAVVRVFGRDPVRMVHGLITNDLAGAPAGQGVYAAVLTPKGKMVAEVRVFRLPSGELWVEVPRGGREPLLEHLRKFLPPLYARFADVSDRYAVLGVYGPAAAEVAARALGGAVPAGRPEDAFEFRPAGEEDGLLVARTLYAGEDGYDVFVPAAEAERVWRALVESGARPAGHGTLEVLRIEAGRPRWGAELGPEVIPLEAGLRDRAISTQKGCYTGQEVIVRILHRGHVNWLLRGLRLGESPAPAPGAALVRPEDGRPVGRVTSACSSPRHGQTIGLGYVRREVVPEAVLRLGGTGGPEVRVVELAGSPAT